MRRLLDITIGLVAGIIIGSFFFSTRSSTPELATREGEHSLTRPNGTKTPKELQSAQESRPAERAPTSRSIKGVIVHEFGEKRTPDGVSTPIPVTIISAPKNQETVATLLDDLVTGDDKGRANALSALSMWMRKHPEDKAVLHALHTNTRTDSLEWNRQRGISALLAFHDAESFDIVMERIQRDPSVTVRAWAIRKLQRLTDPGYLVVLRAGQYPADKAPSLIRDRIREAKETLEQVLQTSQDPRITKAAHRTLAKLERAQ